ncbi:MAG: FAD-dependent oxidoreductase [Pirellulales bacterium]
MLVVEWWGFRWRGDFAQRGLAVTLLDRGPLASEASWAGAGILPPAELSTAIHPYDISRGIGRCRAPTLGGRTERTDRDRQRIPVQKGVHHEGGKTRVKLLLFPLGAIRYSKRKSLSRALDGTARRSRTCRLLRGFAQLITSSRAQPATGGKVLLQSLIAACRKAGVNLVPNTPVVDFEISGDKLTSSSLPLANLTPIIFAFAQRVVRNPAQKLRMEWESSPFVDRCCFTKPSNPFANGDNEGPRYILAMVLYLLIGINGGGSRAMSTTSATWLISNRSLSSFPLEKATLVSIVGLRPGSFDADALFGKSPWPLQCILAAGHFRGPYPSWQVQRYGHDAFVESLAL